ARPPRRVRGSPCAVSLWGPWYSPGRHRVGWERSKIWHRHIGSSFRCWPTSSYYWAVIWRPPPSYGGSPRRAWISRPHSLRSTGCRQGAEPGALHICRIYTWSVSATASALRAGGLGRAATKGWRGYWLDWTRSIAVDHSTSSSSQAT